MTSEILHGSYAWPLRTSSKSIQPHGRVCVVVSFSLNAVYQNRQGPVEQVLFDSPTPRDMAND